METDQMRILTSSFLLAAAMSVVVVACESGSKSDGGSQVQSGGHGGGGNGGHGGNSNGGGAKNEDGTTGGNKPICTGLEPARKGAAYTLHQAAEDRLAAFQAELDNFGIEHPEAAAFAVVSKRVAGQSCFQDADCDTGDSSKYTSQCARYEWDGTNGSCLVGSVDPIPAAPILPRLSCADVSCPSGFQCELEESNGAVGCVEQRTCVLPD
jgi:hypothetical protein